MIASQRGRRGTFVALSVVAAVLVGGLVVVARLVESPSQRAAAASPPRRRPVEVDVVKRPLRHELTLRARSEPRSVMDVAASTVAGSDHDVVSAAPVPNGARVETGHVVVEISGRPVIVLSGDVPLYRDITPGLRGPDVEELHSALEAAGMHTTDEPDAYGPSTQARLAELYRRLGYEAPRDETADAALAAATARVASATSALEAAQRARQHADAAALRRRDRAMAALVALQNKAQRDEALAAARVEAARGAAVASPGDRDLALAAQEATNALEDLRESDRTALADAMSAVADAADQSVAGSDDDAVSAARSELANATTAQREAGAAVGVVARRSELLMVKSLPAVLAEVPAVGTLLSSKSSGPFFRLRSEANALRVTIDDERADQLRVGMVARATIDDTAIELRLATLDDESLDSVRDSGASGSTDAGDESGDAAAGAGVVSIRATFVSDAPIPPQVGTVPVVVELSPPISGGVVVPRSAVVDDGDGTRVTRIRGGSQRGVDVTVLGEADGFVAVTARRNDELRAGDRVVVG